MGRQIVVIGGGAAGMMAAIQAAREGAAVTVYEKNDRVGKKILSTGNGRCNFSNEAMGAEFYHGSGTALLDGALSAFGVARTKAFFASLGMRIRERDGYLYPASDQASTVLDLLRYELDRLRVTVHTGEAVRAFSFDKGKEKFLIRHQGKDLCYDAAILCCGGMAAPNTGSDGDGFRLAERFGHRIVRPVPALAALVCKESFYKQVAGVRCDAALTLRVEGQEAGKERGELQLTDYGLSGIPAFQLCRTAAYALLDKKPVTVRLSFLPDFDGMSCGSFFRERLSAHGGDEMDVFLTGIVNKKISRLLLKLSGIRETQRAEQVSPEAFRRLQELYLSLETVVTGTNGFDRAQVCAGGVDCREVTENLMSKKQPGLYFAGEILDIDGLCGGYNLQWAWSSGTVAGRAAARNP
ncbi:MAG: aminoacetone oxidase family FAD-binding enzyme [Lachnospiraceae bacterium]|nr:aminoacetone oxidase family FAD-binding enzyme [Lachnospiraceae bacterium]